MNSRAALARKTKKVEATPAYEKITNFTSGLQVLLQMKNGALADAPSRRTA